MAIRVLLIFDSGFVVVDAPKVEEIDVVDVSIGWKRIQTQRRLFRCQEMAKKPTR